MNYRPMTYSETTAIDVSRDEKGALGDFVVLAHAVIWEKHS